MSNARRALRAAFESIATEIPSIDALKQNQQVMYKPGTEFEGLLGTIIDIHPETQTVDLRVASSTRMEVPVTDLLMLEEEPSIDEPIEPQTDPVPTEGRRSGSGKNEGIVVRKDGKFWTGSTWSDEYPDALQFSSDTEAQKVADKVGGEVEVDENRNEAIQTDNKTFGFYGTVKSNFSLSDSDAAKAFDETGKMLGRMLALDDDQAVKALDSTYGRHFADMLSNKADDSEGLAAVKGALTKVNKQELTKAFPKEAWNWE
jgi:hypothetical protein